MQIRGQTDVRTSSPLIAHKYRRASSLSAEWRKVFGSSQATVSAHCNRKVLQLIYYANFKKATPISMARAIFEQFRADKIKQLGPSKGSRSPRITFLAWEAMRRKVHSELCAVPADLL